MIEILHVWQHYILEILFQEIFFAGKKLFNSLSCNVGNECSLMTFDARDIKKFNSG